MNHPHVRHNEFDQVILSNVGFIPSGAPKGSRENLVTNRFTLVILFSARKLRQSGALDFIALLIVYSATNWRASLSQIDGRRAAAFALEEIGVANAAVEGSNIVHDLPGTTVKELRLLVGREQENCRPMLYVRKGF